jgi:hypothetical protein
MKELGTTHHDQRSLQAMHIYGSKADPPTGRRSTDRLAWTDALLPKLRTFG